MCFFYMLPCMEDHVDCINGESGEFPIYLTLLGVALIVGPAIDGGDAGMKTALQVIGSVPLTLGSGVVPWLDYVGKALCRRRPELSPRPAAADEALCKRGGASDNGSQDDEDKIVDGREQNDAAELRIGITIMDNQQAEPDQLEGNEEERLRAAIAEAHQQAARQQKPVTAVLTANEELKRRLMHDVAPPQTTPSGCGCRVM